MDVETPDVPQSRAMPNAASRYVPSAFDNRVRMQGRPMTEVNDMACPVKSYFWRTTFAVAGLILLAGIVVVVIELLGGQAQPLRKNPLY